MADYRLYCFDGAGTVWAADWMEAASDEEAILAARSLNTGVKCEVWQGRRFVATIERSQSPPPGASVATLPTEIRPTEL